ncbi:MULTISPECIES: hypothetical protein [Ruegeria]|uniref:Uncharacterized protein n=2 Tax=Ruegeria TaxID=97050 RepID=A0A6B2NHJ2_9RHOB|nr:MULTISPECIES: hypothetical protein [unclassified Ruegeria]MCU9839709.1 hypothetical protein [Ruegeria sp. WL0004]NDW43632.1 hypothetical protein [Ruegeria sp. PrR005]
MFLELIGTLVAGLALAGVVMALNRLLGGRLPRWLAPVAAGCGMIGVTIASEYGWYARTRAPLPDAMQIIETVESRALYRPWTYVVPFVNRFAAIDAGSVRTNPAQPGQRLVDLYLFGRWAPVSKLPVLVDCDGFRRANLADGAEFGADGAVLNADWRQPPAGDPLIVATCEV